MIIVIIFFYLIVELIKFIIYNDLELIIGDFGSFLWIMLELSGCFYLIVFSCIL